MLISCTGIHKFYQDHHVLRSVSLTVENQDRIGLVGDNGCGKSTFLRILTEQELPDAFEHRLRHGEVNEPQQPISGSAILRRMQGSTAAKPSSRR